MPAGATGPAFINRGNLVAAGTAVRIMAGISGWIPGPGQRKLGYSVVSAGAVSSAGGVAQIGAARFSRSTRGWRAAMRSSASADPSGLRRPCSQFRKV